MLEYLHQDHLGSTILVTDSNGNPKEAETYKPYGTSTTNSLTTSYRWTGGETDESGLYYFNARYYSPELGRFISADPAVIFGKDISIEELCNPYMYAKNNPIKYLDPTGEEVVLFSDNEMFLKAINFLYKKSKTFKDNMNKLFSNKNNNGERLLVEIKTGPLNSDTKGLARTTNVTTVDNHATYAIDQAGKIIDSTIEKGENVQYISITVDMEKIDDMLNTFGVITEEVMHAVDASQLGSEKFNEQLKYEQETYPYSEQSLEVSAKKRTRIVLEEAYE